MAILLYNDLKKETDPRNALLNFMESAYVAGATLAGWQMEDLKVPELIEL